MSIKGVEEDIDIYKLTGDDKDLHHTEKIGKVLSDLEKLQMDIRKRIINLKKEDNNIPLVMPKKILWPKPDYIKDRYQVPKKQKERKLNRIYGFEKDNIEEEIENLEIKFLESQDGAELGKISSEITNLTQKLEEEELIDTKTNKASSSDKGKAPMTYRRIRPFNPWTSRGQTPLRDIFQGLRRDKGVVIEENTGSRYTSAKEEESDSDEIDEMIIDESNEEFKNISQRVSESIKRGENDYERAKKAYRDFEEENPIPTMKTETPAGKYKQEFLPNNGMFLDIDCLETPGNHIDKWQDINWLYISKNNPEWTAQQVADYLPVTLQGMLRDWWNGLSNESRVRIRTGQESDFETEVFINQDLSMVLQRFVFAIKRQFLGEAWSTHQAAQQRANRNVNKNYLEKMKLCDICYLEEFLCKYTKVFYKAFAEEDFTDNTYIKNYIFTKFPGIYANKLQKKWNKLVDQGIEVNTLGARIYFIRSKINAWCDKARLLAKTNKATKQGLCCNKQEPDYEFGCKTIKTKRRPKPKYKKKWRKYSKKYRMKPITRKKSYKRPLYKKKSRNFSSHRGDIGEKNKNNERKGKISSKEKHKKCKCWHCGLEGHYANECPRKKEIPTRLIEEYSPIDTEEDIPDEIEIYYLSEETIEETSSSEESNE